MMQSEKTSKNQTKSKMKMEVASWCGKKVKQSYYDVYMSMYDKKC